MGITFEIYDKAMASPYDDCTQNYTYIKDDKCSQICLGAKVGVCPVKIVVEAGNLTKGTCAAAGYPHDTGTSTTAKAGPCGEITFEIYDKATDDDASCTTYTHVQDGNCGQDCLGDMVGICPVAVVVAAGNCMGDSLRNQHKDPSKVKLSINSDGSLTFHSPWPNLKLKKKSSVVVLK